jgi:hypothetical protein
MAVMPHHQRSDPVKTPSVVATAAAGSNPPRGAKPAKMAANMMMVGGLVSVSRTEPA